MDAPFKWDLPHEWAEESSWEGLEFTLYFDRPITESEKEELSRMILAWYEVGSWGGYGPSDQGKGVLHFMSDIAVKNDDSEPRAEWWVDMGSATKVALGALMLCLQNWSSESEVPVAKLVSGRQPSSNSDQ